ncbi:alpha/beta hydrolase [Cytobacillus horneckiae]|uniref:Alpha/beta hydrolase n=3 Tax=Cytobacillus horneckiae TaxID=549687 RepID=A0A2N0ZAA7_9BACI|nr:alpha/beta hydrolase [Cytobacillus horneckiae]
MEITLNNGETLFYRKREGGETLLLLIHGNLASSDQWDILLETLPIEYTIYAIDLRGYGKSTYHKPIKALNDFALDIELFCNELNLKSSHLIGLSNGGGIAMQFAANYPSRVEKLILLASISTRGYPAYNSNGARLQSKEEIASDSMINRMLNAQKAQEMSFFEAAMNQLVYPHSKPEKARLEKDVEAALNQRNMVDVADAANRFNLSSVSNGVAEGTGELQRINASVLVLWGQNDLMVLEQMTLEIIHDMKEHDIDVTYKVLNTGHSPLVDDIQSVVSEIEGFLQK